MKLNIPQSYRLPIILAVILHIVVIGCLFVRMTQHGLPVHSAKFEPKVVQAVAVSQSAVQHQIHKILRQQKRHQRKRQAKIAAVKHRRLITRRRVQQQRIAKAKAVKLKHQQVKQAKQKAVRQQKLRVLAKQQQQLQQKLMQQQLAKEQRQMQQAHVQQIRGAANQYRQKMLSYIGGHWIVPEPAQHQAWQCVFSVHLAANGDVLAVKLLQSSGHPALDRSARAAIFRSSPLPIPSNPEVFDKLRELRLTMSPKTIRVEDEHA